MTGPRLAVALARTLGVRRVAIGYVGDFSLVTRFGYIWPDDRDKFAAITHLGGPRWAVWLVRRLGVR